MCWHQPIEQQFCILYVSDLVFWHCFKTARLTTGPLFFPVLNVSFGIVIVYVVIVVSHRSVKTSLSQLNSVADHTILVD